jgi:hypothetical protein
LTSASSTVTRSWTVLLAAEILKYFWYTGLSVTATVYLPGARSKSVSPWVGSSDDG